jgi:L-malate glycosyltransferase
MKILFFNYEYPPLGGGAANATAYILREYSTLENLEVDLVTSSIDENFHEEKIGKNVTIYKIPIGKNSANLHYQSQKDILLYTWRAFFFARKLCRRNNYALSHSFFTLPCGLISLILRQISGLSYVVSLRGSDVPGYSDRFPLIYFFLRPIFRLIWKKAEAVVSNSEGLRELALKTNRSQEISIIYNRIDTEKFLPASSDQPKKDFVITPGASRITARKGLNFLVEAVSILAPKYENIRLKIMGDGNERENLEKLVEKLKLKDKIQFLGRIPREKTPAYYQEASVFVLPSLNEGMSNAMLEALASGLPILATDTGGAKELVADGENGYILKMKNSKDIAEKLEGLIKDENLRKQMGEASRARAEKLSWKNVAGEYESLYHKINKSINQ